MIWKNLYFSRMLVIVAGIGFLLAGCWSEDHKGLILLPLVCLAAWRTTAPCNYSPRSQWFTGVLIFGGVILAQYHYHIFSYPILTIGLIGLWMLSIGNLFRKLARANLDCNY